MKKEDCLILAVWGVILIGIGSAVYYGAKYYNNENVLKAIQKEKESLPADKEINKYTNNPATPNNIINGVIKNKSKNTNTKSNTKTNTNNNKSNTNTKSSSNSNTGNTNINNNNNNNENSNSNSSSTVSNNNSNSSNNSNAQTGSNPINIKPRILLFEGTEEHSETRTKYGTIITKTDVYIVMTYDDNTTDKYLNTIRYDFNRDGYNGNTEILKPEAIEVMNNNYSNYERLNNIINGYRSEVGSTPLVLDRNLCLIATIRAIERAYGLPEYVLTHDRPGGKKLKTIFEEFNISGEPGENITTKKVTGIGNIPDIYPLEKAASDWYNSNDHKLNLQDNSYGKTGIGVYQLGDIKYWVQIFQKK